MVEHLSDMCKALCSMPGRSRGKDGGRHGRKKYLALTIHANEEQHDEILMNGNNKNVKGLQMEYTDY